MIKNYDLFLINEGITISNEDIVDIIKSLETEDNKNAALINKLVNHKDSKGVTVLMNIVRSNKEDLIDYVLKFNPDLNAQTKLNENVLFFCKNIKTFIKFYNLGVDYNIKTTYNFNVLLYLASKNIFNEDIYQKLINSGVNINQKTLNKITVLNYLIINKKAVEFLIRNKIDLNNDNQLQYISDLFRTYKYYIKKRNNILEIFEILFKNGMKIINNSSFVSNLDDMIYFNEDDYINNKKKHVEMFTSRFIKYFSDELIIDLYTKVTNYFNMDQAKDFAIMILDSGNRYKFYDFLKNRFWGTRFYEYFGDYIKEHPYFEDVGKYNL